MNRLISILLTLLVISCSNDRDIPNRNVMPNALRLVVLNKEGKELIDKNTSPQLIYSFNKEGKKFYTNAGNGAGIENFQDTTKYKFFYDDLGIAMASINGVKTFYLEIGGKVDTIYLDVQEYDQASAIKHNTDYYYKELLLNGKEMPIDESVMPPVAVIQRK
jgi:hypothetical protein